MVAPVSPGFTLGTSGAGPTGVVGTVVVTGGVVVEVDVLETDFPTAPDARVVVVVADFTVVVVADARPGAGSAGHVTDSLTTRSGGASSGHGATVVVVVVAD